MLNDLGIRNLWAVVDGLIPKVPLSARKLTQRRPFLKEYKVKPSYHPFRGARFESCATEVEYKEGNDRSTPRLVWGAD